MKQRTLLLIDAGGALVTVALLSAVAWYAFLKPDTATSQMRALSGQVMQLRADLQQLHSGLGRQRVVHAKLTAAAAQRGRLPTKSPVEQDLRRITSVAKDNDVKFLEVEPLSRVRYPNVLELRYRVRAVGTYVNHLRFLEAFEQCSFWADVTHLRLEQKTPDITGSDPVCHSDMTLSFFSADQ